MVYDSHLNEVGNLSRLRGYSLNKENAVIYYDSYTGYYSSDDLSRVYYIVENVAVWFAVVIPILCVIGLALLIPGIWYLRRKYQEWREKRREEEAAKKEKS